MSDSKIEDPAALKRAGNGAREIALSTGTTLKHPVQETRDAAHTLGGENWEGDLGKTLKEMSDLWESQSTSLSRRMHQAAQALSETGTNYATVESKNTKAMQDGLADFN